MKMAVKTEIEVPFIELTLPVRYGQEDIPNNFPLRKGDVWTALVEIDTGIIQGWPPGVNAEMYMKVCDDGTYRLLNGNGKEIAKLEQEYVPHGIVPGEYGDYVDFKIDESGRILNWPKNPSAEDFNREED